MQHTLPPVPQHPLPTRIQQVILDYGFADRNILQRVVAHRVHGDWFAALLHDEGEGCYWAIELEKLDGNWEIVNDYSGPFETVQEFHSRRPATCFR